MRLRKSLFAWMAAFLILDSTASAVSVRRLILPTNDLVFNPADGRIYASIPSRAGVLGNRIAAIDPQTGAITSSIPVGSEPRKLALADDGRTLYVGLDGAGAVRRVDLVKQTAELQFSLGRQGLFDVGTGPNFAGDIKVLPGHPESVAVARTAYAGTPRGTGVAVYDNGVPRPQILKYFSGNNVIAFGELPSRLYGYDQEETTFEFRRMTVAASGVLPGDSISGLISGVVDIQYDHGRIYTSSGLIVDPEAATVVGQFPGIPSQPFGPGPVVPVLPDSAARRVYFVIAGGPGLQLQAFDPQTRARLGAVDVPSISFWCEMPGRWLVTDKLASS
jgi:trimeric autotransporter adhesin